jgi:hypothetical protein
MKLTSLSIATALMLCVITTTFSAKNCLAHGGYVTPFTGIGVSYEYSWCNKYDDTSVYITAKHGTFSFISYFLTLDFGQRIDDNVIIYRVGGEAYIGPGILGIHAGINNKYDSGSGDYYDGKSASYGITAALPFNPSLFLIAGQEKVNNNSYESFLRASLMYNFRTGIHFSY